VAKLALLALPVCRLCGWGKAKCANEGWHKIELKKVRWKKIKNTEGSAKSVGLLVVHL